MPGRAKWLMGSYNQGGTWVAFKKFGRWEKPVHLSLGPLSLNRWRLAVAEEYAAFLKGNPEPSQRIGFVPRTFAVWAAERFSGAPLPKAIVEADLLLSFALYQTIRCYEGTWQSGPIGNGTRLPAIYTDGLEERPITSER